MDSMEQVGRSPSQSSSALHTASSGSGRSSTYTDGSSTSTAVGPVLNESAEFISSFVPCPAGMTKSEFERRIDVGASQRWIKHREMGDAAPAATCGHHAQCDTCHWTQAHGHDDKAPAGAAAPVPAATAPTCDYETALANVLSALGNELDASQSAGPPLQMDIRMTFTTAAGGGEPIPVLHGTVSRWRDERAPMQHGDYGRPRASQSQSTMDVCAPFYESPWQWHGAGGGGASGSRPVRLYGPPASVDVSLAASCRACYSPSGKSSGGQPQGKCAVHEDPAATAQRGRNGGDHYTSGGQANADEAGRQRRHP